MAIANARPTLWSAKILESLHTLLVFAGPSVINRDYEGEIAQQGDTVKITTVGPVKVSNYTKGTDMSAAESLTDAALTLAIDQQKSFNFEVDIIDSTQAALGINLQNEGSREAAYALAKEADTFLAEKWKDIDTGNKGSSFKWGTAEKIYELIVELGILLDKTDTPNDGRRFVVLPPDAVGNLQRDIRFIGYGTAANRAQLEGGLPQAPNGYIGKAANFNVYQSNQVQSESSKYKVMGGHPMAWSYAEQISKVVAYEPPLRFSTAVKGLHVYGAKVVRPSNLAYAIAEA
jgi:hypothetical protein